MLQSQKIKELRTSGNLAEALELAVADLEGAPDSIYAKRNISWVYYAMLKKHAEESGFDAFMATLELIKKLELPADEKMLFNNIAIPLAKMFRNLAATKPIDYTKANLLFESSKHFPFEKPLLNYSILLGGLQKAFKDSAKYLEVIDWWDIDNLRPEDYLEEEFNGRTIMALAEQVYISYAKHLEIGKPLDQYGNNTEIDKPKIEEFLPKLEEVIEKYPMFVYPPYFKAKLLIKLGDDDVLSSFIPFARKKKNDYWVWQLMTEIYKHNQEIVFSCYCKALTLKTPDEFLVKIRQNLAEILIKKNLYDEAKTEIERILLVKEKTQTKVPSKVQMWQNSDWFKNAKPFKNNREFYKSNCLEAEEILFNDINQETVAVDYVNYEKQIVNFVKNKNKSGFFKYSGLIEDPEIGDILEIRFAEESRENQYKALTIKFSESSNCEAVQIFAGNVRIISSGIGFLDDCFIDKSLIEQHTVKNNEHIKAKALLSFNKKKNEWGWKAVKIKKMQ